MHLALGTGPKRFAQDLTKSPLSPGPVLENYFGQAKQGYRPRALLVEDNPINLKLLVTFIEKLGYPYATATDGLEAVQAYQSSNGRFDIIFIDIQMPIMDGMAASCEIRKFEQQNGLERTPIIALTGLASADAQEQAVLSGIDLFLTKPVPLRRLRAVVEEHCPAPRGEG
jgi:CheY-like chemotaxis protein